MCSKFSNPLFDDSPFKNAKNPRSFRALRAQIDPKFWALRSQGFIFLEILVNLWARGFNDGGGVNSNWTVVSQIFFKIFFFSKKNRCQKNFKKFWSRKIQKNSKFLGIEILSFRDFGKNQLFSKFQKKSDFF